MKPPRAGSLDAWWQAAEFVLEKIALWAYVSGWYGGQLTREIAAWSKDLRGGTRDIRARCRRVSASMARFARCTKSEYDASVARSLSHALSDSPKTGNPRLRRPNAGGH